MDNKTQQPKVADTAKSDMALHHEKVPVIISEHKFIALIVLVIAVAFILVLVAMHLYNSSGAAQLDLSRPGYQSVREKSRDNTTDSEAAFPSTGKLDQESLSSFKTMYDTRSERITSIKGFQNDVLSDEALNMYGESSGSSAE